MTDRKWHHICMARSSSGGIWKLYQDGIIKASETGFAADVRMENGYLIIGAFKGNLALFNMWDEYIDDFLLIKDLTCSQHWTGNVVPWPVVQFWLVGNVAVKNCSIWKYSGEKALNKTDLG